MAYVIQSLKEKFPDIYKFLLRNQKSHNLIFFSPNGKLYAKESLKEKSFYYHHIFQKSRFDPTLYTNFYGKVLKLISDTAYKTYLGWTLEMIINVLESSYNDEGLFFYQTDGICIEEYSNVVKITDKDSLPCKRCSDSTEYLKYFYKFKININ